MTVTGSVMGVVLSPEQESGRGGIGTRVAGGRPHREVCRGQRGWGSPCKDKPRNLTSEQWP